MANYRIVSLIHTDSIGILQIMDDPDKFVQYTLFFNIKRSDRIESGTINGAEKKDVRLPNWLVLAY